MQLFLCSVFWDAWDHTWIALTGFCTFVLAFCAYKALYVWKQQTDYQLKIESLAFSRVCIRYVKYLRQVNSSAGEILPEFQEEAEKFKKKATLPDTSYFIYLSRQRNYKEVYERLNQFYEQNWASNGEKNEFTIFFKRVLDIVQQVDLANYRVFLALGNYQHDANYYQETVNSTSEIIYTHDEDPINKELDDMVKSLEVHRKAKKI